MTTPTAEEFRNVIADELEALAKRVRAENVRIDRSTKTGHVGVSSSRDAMIETARTTEFLIDGGGWSAKIEIYDARPAS